jgi:hypothetical protein
MYIAEELWSVFETSHPDPELESGIGTLRADLEAFVDGPHFIRAISFCFRRRERVFGRSAAHQSRRPALTGSTKYSMTATLQVPARR